MESFRSEYECKIEYEYDFSFQTGYVPRALIPLAGAWVIERFRSEYEYEIEYEYDVRIFQTSYVPSLQRRLLRSQNSRFSLLLISRGKGQGNPIHRFGDLFGSPVIAYDFCLKCDGKLEFSLAQIFCKVR